jgi:hypothetical protein
MSRFALQVVCLRAVPLNPIRSIIRSLYRNAVLHDDAVGGSRDWQALGLLTLSGISALLGVTTAHAGNGIHINANPDRQCASVNESQPYFWTLNNSELLRETFTFQDRSVACDAGSKAGQTDTVLFYRPNAGVGATSLSLGGELYVNSGRLMLGDRAGSMLIGHSDQTVGDALVSDGGMALGRGAKATALGSTAFGLGAQAQNPYALAFGNVAAATNTNATTLGAAATASGDGATILGPTARAGGNSSFAAGRFAQSTAVNSVALGRSSIASGGNSLSVGFTSRSRDSDGVALGSFSVGLAGGLRDVAPVTLNGVTYSVDRTHAISTVSLGDEARLRQLANLAPGSVAPNSTDAVNGAQLFAGYDAIQRLGERELIASQSVADALGVGMARQDGKLVVPPLSLTSLAPDERQPNTVLGALNALDRSHKDADHGLGQVFERVFDTAMEVNQWDHSNRLRWNPQTNTYSAVHGDTAQNRIVNLAAGKADTDAANKGQLDTVEGVALTAKHAAEAANEVANDVHRVATNAEAAANRAQATAAQGERDSGEAGQIASAARDTADAAVEAVAKAHQTVDMAQGTASSAAEAARSAQAAAVIAQDAASQALDSATGAEQVTAAAKADAEAAANAVNDARRVVDTAEQQAEAAKNSASMAQAGADGAQRAATAAHDTATVARGSAEVAQRNADTALQAGLTAQAAAEAAHDTATRAQDSAVTARQAAEAAQGTADTALNTAAGARQAADAAQGTAGSAGTAAEAARQTAGTAESTALEAQVSASEAQQAAEAAQATGEGALSTAATAQGAAEAAQGTADTALSAASSAQQHAASAQRTANVAQDSASTAQQTATAVQQAADRALASASSVQQSASAVQGQADQAHASATAAQQAVAGAQGTADNAMTSATSAQQAAVLAQGSADQALSAADTAQGSADAARGTADRALTAASTAQQVADDAQRTAETASSSASTAQQRASGAQRTADAALELAANARQSADAGQAAASGALSAATDAQRAAGRAQVVADNALSVAGDAQRSAEVAQVTAGTAVGTASTAHERAAVAQGAADTALRSASTAQHAAETAQGTANAARATADSAAGQLQGIGIGETVLERINSAIQRAAGSASERLAQVLGGGSTVGADGQPTAPSYSIGQIADDGSVQPSTQTHGNVGDALGALDGNVAKLGGAVEGQGEALKTMAQEAGTLGEDSLLWDEASGTYSAGRDDQRTAPARITRLAAGAAATDLVNKSQLDAVDAVATAARDTVERVQDAAEQARVTAAGATTVAANASGAADGAQRTGDQAQASAADARQVADVAQATAYQAGQRTESSAEHLQGLADGETVLGRIQSSARGGNQALAYALGEGAAVNPDGTLNAPIFNLTEVRADGAPSTVSAGNVGQAIQVLDDSLVAANDKAANANADVSELRTELEAGEVGLVRQDPGSRDIQIAKGADGTRVDIAGSQGARTVGGLQDGTLGADSTDAVTGRQLDATNQQVRQLGQQASVVAADSQGDGSDKASVTPGSRAVAIGSDSRATGERSVAGGAGAAAEGARSTALGADARASGNNSVALGAGSQAGRANSVSVGSSGGERQITQVADATRGTDAVNLRQTTRLSSQAANRTLYQSNAYTDRQVGHLRQDIYAGVAAAMAMASLPVASSSGKSMLAMAAAVYEGQSALAIGVNARSQGGSWTYNAVGAGTARGDFGINLGLGYHW